MRSEGRLARRAARGDRDAFATIFRRHQQDLYRYCVAILGDREDAQDALQNTMVKALRALPGEKREIELKPWLYRVAHNESIELRRRRRVSQSLVDDVAAPGVSLEQSATERERLRHLLLDLDELPERQRGALVMRELGGLDFAQIGAALDTSPRAARQVLYEARRGLQQMSEGREMECDAVCALLSDNDGRVARRRDVRAHLRDCAGCREFAQGIHSRSATLAAISPLPALVAAGLVKGALSASAVGGTAAGGTAGSVTGAAAGAGAKAVETGVILKSAAGVIAIVAAGAVAVDHHQLLTGGGAAHPAPRVSGPDAGASATANPTPVIRPARLSTSRPRAIGGDRGQDRVLTGPKRERAHDGRGRGAVEGTPLTERSTVASTAAPGDPPALESVARPGKPVHPSHPAHPENASSVAQPAHPAHPAHLAASAGTHSSGAAAGSRPTHPEHPAKAADGTEVAEEAAAAESQSEVADGQGKAVGAAEEAGAEVAEEAKKK